MKNPFRLLIILCFMTMHSFSFATRIPDGWFVGFFGDASYIKGVDFTIPPIAELALDISLLSNGFDELDDPFGNIVFAVGGGGGAQAGYRFCGVRLEAELMFNITPYKQMRIDGYRFKQAQQAAVLPNIGPVVIFPYSMSGSVVYGTGFLNLAYDLYFTPEASFYPYAGVGIGYSYLYTQYRINYYSPAQTTSSASTTTNINNNSTTILRYSNHQFVPMGQGIVGLAFQLDDFCSVGIDYRYLTTINNRFETFDQRLTTHTVNLSMNHWFN